ncbi:MAG TPA: helix-turn-helix domain-containing protein, partial [Gemmatimonadales bacterium]|nr:helix-turn-helix domain-containing protein [Gemmatimonadales bacterium]
EEWDVVVAAVGDPIESDLRPWLEALEEARGHPRFIALVKQSSGVPAASEGAGTLAELEGWHIARVMKETGGRIESAARILGIHRNTLARKLKSLGNRLGVST